MKKGTSTIHSNLGQKAFYSIIFFLLVSFFSFTKGQTVLNTSGNTVDVSYSGGVQDIIIPSNPSLTEIDFTLLGADGGSAAVKDPGIYSDLLGWIIYPSILKTRGGRGAKTTARFRIGNGTGEIPYGSTIRCIVGQRGYNNGSVATLGTGYAYGGGGGGTGLLYKPPGSSTWTLLAVAGGGGGAHQGMLVYINADAHIGGAGRSSTSGGNGNGTSAGLGGSYGVGGKGSSVGGGGGGAHSTTGGGISCVSFNGSSTNGEGGRGYSGGGYGGFSEGCVSLPWANGGYGYGGGGAGSGGGGGGGGYSGGGNGGLFGRGGGGGSYLHSMSVSGTKSTGNVNGASTSLNGLITYRSILNEPPVAICKNNISVRLNASGDAFISYPQVNNGSYDPEGGSLIYGLSKSRFNCSNIGPNTVTLTVTDNTGKSSSCTTVVNIEDDAKPIAKCKPVTIQLNSMGTASLSPEQVDNGSSDNCGIASMSVSPNGFDCSNVGLNEVILTVTDVNGNSSTCTTTVKVEDNVKPEAVCQTVTIQLDELGAASITAGQINNGSSDNCGIASLSVDPDNFTCSDLGENTVTLTVTDVNGNTNTCQTIVNVEDIIFPELTACPADIELCGEQAVFWNAPTASDNCSAILTSNYNPGDIFPVGTTTVTYVATDIANNQVSCSFDITIRSLPEEMITATETPIFCQGYAQLDVTVTNTDDLLLPLTYEWSHDLGNETSVIVFGNDTYQVSVTDGYGCQTSTTYTLNINPADFLSGYTLIAQKDVDLKESIVHSGGVGVMDYNKKAKIKYNSQVYGFVNALDIYTDNSSTIEEKIFGQPNITLPPFYENTTSGGDDISVPANQSITLTGEVYDDIQVNDGATLIINSSEIYLDKLKVKDDGTIIFLQSCNVMVDDDVNLDKNVSIISNGYSVTFYTGKKFEVEEGGLIEANVYSQKDIYVKAAKADNRTEMHGMFISLYKIKSKEYVDWYQSTSCDPAPIPDGVNNYHSLRSKNIETREQDLLGIIENASIRLYPNPTSGQTTIELAGVNEKSKLSVVDQIGRVIFTKNVLAGESQVQLDFSETEISNGIYFVSIVSVNQRLIKQLIVQK